MIFGTLASIALAASTVSARTLSTRQSSGLPGGAEIPDACTDTCSSTLTLYQACDSGDTATCLQICSQENTNSLYNCLNCAFENQQFTESQYNTLTATVQTLTTSCGAIGQSNTPSTTIPAYADLQQIYATATFASEAPAAQTDSESASVASSSASVEASSASSSVASATSSLAAVISSGAASASASSTSMRSSMTSSSPAGASGGVLPSASAAVTSGAANQGSGAEKTLAFGGISAVLAGLGAIFLL